MKKVMILTAAALAAMCSGAVAKSITVQLSDYCDEYTLTNSGVLYAILSDSTTCDPGLGGGTKGRVKGSGTLITTGIILNSSSTEQYVWTFTAPLANNGTAILYYTTDGKTLNYLTQSPYTIVGAGSRQNVNRPPATQAVRN